MSEPTKQFIVSLTEAFDHLDVTFGPFPSVDAAEAWLKKHGFLDEPDDFWTHRILKLQPELDQDFIDTLAADKKANEEHLQRQAVLAAKMQRLRNIQNGTSS